MNLLLRAWLPREKRMLQHDDVSIIEGQVFERYCDENGYIRNTLKPDAILMTSFGLVDRNDKPIYVGDIVKKIAPLSTIISEVVVVDGVMKLKSMEYKRDGTQNDEFPKQLDISVLQSPYQRYEIIGNIYENSVLLLDYPELLEG